MFDHFWRATKPLSPHKLKGYPPTPPSNDYSMNQPMPGLEEAASTAQDETNHVFNDQGAGGMVEDTAQAGENEFTLPISEGSFEALQAFNEQPETLTSESQVMSSIPEVQGDDKIDDNMVASADTQLGDVVAEGDTMSAETSQVTEAPPANRGSEYEAEDSASLAPPCHEDREGDRQVADSFDELQAMLFDDANDMEGKITPDPTIESQIHPDVDIEYQSQISIIPTSPNQGSVDGASRSKTPEASADTIRENMESFPNLPNGIPAPSVESSSKSATPEAPAATIPARTTSLAPPSPTRRARSEEPVSTRDYSFAASWPPSEPPSSELAQRIDLFPPKDAPLHVWMQAYALRWGTWTAEIKDDVKRQQILNTVADKMKAAWDTGISEGYYARPTTDSSTGQNDDSDGQHKSRKRALSFSKQSAGFAYDGGKDKLAITNGELAEHGLTFDQIKARVESGDYDAGELRLQEVFEALGREHIKQSDWSINKLYPVIHGRNLLMYALFVVQDTRTSLQRLRNLYKSFTRDNQRRNTQARIDAACEREYQHLALATELTLKDPQRKASSSDDTVDLTSEAGEAASEEIDTDTSEIEIAQVDVGEQIITELAQEVLSVTNGGEAAILNAYASRKLQQKDFGNAGLDVGDNEQFKQARSLLGHMLSFVTAASGLKQKSRSQNPGEAIRIGHDIRLTMVKFGQTAQALHKCLSGKINVAEPVYLRIHQQLQAQAQKNAMLQQAQLPKVNNPAAAPAPAEPASNSTPIRQRPAPLNVTPPSTIAPPPSPRAPVKQAVIMPSPPVPEQNQARPLPLTPAPVTNDPATEAAAKKAYINESWVPMLNKALGGIGKGPVPDGLDSWPKIKKILEESGYTTEERNNMLKQFKSGFDTWCEHKGIRNSKSSTESPTPSILATTKPATPPPASPSPRLATASSTMPNWPSNAEIIAAIPPDGIAAHALVKQFGPRIGNQTGYFMRTLQSLSDFDPPTYTAYPKAPTPSQSRQYNTLPPNSHLSQSQAPNPRSLTLKFRPQSVDESLFPDEFKSTEVNSSRGFFFRHLPHATLEQRQSMDERIDEYITETKKSRKKNAGQYITFKDPDSPNAGPVAHGFWELKGGERPAESEWFFAGEGVPESWSLSGDEEKVQGGLKLKLKVGNANGHGHGQGHGQGQSQTGMVNGRARMGAEQGDYNVMPPDYPPTGYGRGRTGYPQTVAPAQLSAYQPADRFMVDAMAHGGQGDGGQGGERGTKRGVSGSGGGKGRKKRKLVDDDDDEYRPDQEY